MARKVQGGIGGSGTVSGRWETASGSVQGARRRVRVTAGGPQSKGHGQCGRVTVRFNRSRSVSKGHGQCQRVMVRVKGSW